MSHQYPDSRQWSRKVVGAVRGQVSESALKTHVPRAHPRPVYSQLCRSDIGYVVSHIVKQVGHIGNALMS